MTDVVKQGDTADAFRVKLLAARRKCPLSDAEIGRRADIHRTRSHRICRGQFSRLSAPVLKVAAILGVDDPALTDLRRIEDRTKLLRERRDNLQDRALFSADGVTIFKAGLMQAIAASGLKVSEIAKLAGIHRTHCYRVCRGDFSKINAAALAVARVVDTRSADPVAFARSNDDWHRIERRVRELWDGSSQGAEKLMAALDVAGRTGDRKGEHGRFQSRVGVISEREAASSMASGDFPHAASRHQRA